MELILVVAILAILAAVTVPSFVRSIRGNRLRTAARTVVMAGRYARSMAILSQQEQVVTFDLDKGQVTVGPVGDISSSVKTDTGAGESQVEQEVSTREQAQGSGEDEALSSAAGSPQKGMLGRKLDGVRIEWINIAGQEDGRKSGKCAVVYQTNGRCSPYELKIMDERGSSITVRVDMFSSAETEIDA